MYKYTKYGIIIHRGNTPTISSINKLEVFIWRFGKQYMKLIKKENNYVRF